MAQVQVQVGVRVPVPVPVQAQAQVQVQVQVPGLAWEAVTEPAKELAMEPEQALVRRQAQVPVYQR